MSSIFTMQRLSRTAGRRACLRPLTPRRGIMAAASPAKREGDISSVFVSLSGGERPELPRRFLVLKRRLVEGREDRVIASWGRLLERLRVDNDAIAKRGPGVIPQLRFQHLDGDLGRLRSEIRKRGAAVVRGVVPEDEARAYKFEVEEYVKRNPQTKGFPAHQPQVFELYWSRPQVRARAHPNLVKTQQSLMKQIWSSSDPEAPISLSQPITYADRLRIRQPGDATFALGPHQDGGSVERWEEEGYGRGGVYEEVFAGNLEGYDPWDAATRLEAVTDLYNGPGNCSAFRMFQAWLSMSCSGPEQGTLLVHPNLQLSTAYILLRPFFRARRRHLEGDALWDPSNWAFTRGDDLTAELHGATPGHGQDVSPEFHPHLQLEKTMVHIPDIRPGDFVVWHCDAIHSVDKSHKGATDSSVMYIPVCPLTENNAKYLVKQREAFAAGVPAPDFPGGKGESEHAGRASPADIEEVSGKDGLRTMGMERLIPNADESSGGLEAIRRSSVVLGLG